MSLERKKVMIIRNLGEVDETSECGTVCFDRKRGFAGVKGLQVVAFERIHSANIPQNRRTDVVYCISSWWRDLSAVTVDPLGYPQMWREPSTSTGVYILYIYI